LEVDVELTLSDLFLEVLEFLELIRMSELDVLAGDRLKEQVCFWVAGTRIS
jgi:hypothetical protein